MPGGGKIDYTLRFASEILGLEHTHWGFFPTSAAENRSWTLAEFKEAQDAYDQYLLGFLPDQVRTVLDAGSGLGKTAKLLGARGYETRCLVDETYRRTVINERYPDLPVIQGSLESMPAQGGFDLILLGEGAGQLRRPRALARSGELLNAGGHLLISDYFRRMDEPYYGDRPVKEEFDRRLAAAGFTLAREEDITSRVLPTLDCAFHHCQEYILPTLNILLEMAENKLGPLPRFLAKLAYRKKLAKLWYMAYEEIPRKLDRSHFQERMIYAVELWRRG